MKVLLCLALILSMLRAGASPAYKSVCKDLLNYIYRDITLKNMRLSLERLNRKMILAYISALKSTSEENVDFFKNPEIFQLIESMKKTDPDLSAFLKSHGPYKSHKFYSYFRFGYEQPEAIYYPDMVSKWKEIQSQRPELFKELSSEQLLDDWDLKTGELLQSYSEARANGQRLNYDLQELAQRYQKNIQELNAGKSSGLSQAIKENTNKVKKLERSFNNSAKDLFWKALDDYKDVCDLSDINAVIGADSLSCPYIRADSAPLELSRHLSAISDSLDSDFLERNAKRPLKPVEVVKFNYRNLNPRGAYCERSPELVDTAVIHHSGSRSDMNPQKLHNNQVVAFENSREPWYMIGYNYLIQSPRKGRSGDIKVFSGRPDHIKGSHTGSDVRLSQVDPKVRSLLKLADFKCGWNRNKDPKHKIDRRNRSKEAYMKRKLARGVVSSNMTSTGILVMGNYAPDIVNGSPNPGGYRSNGPALYPSDDTLRTTARLICQLRANNYPHLRKIADHNSIKIKKDLADGKRTKGTCCPGTVYKRMSRVLELTREECPQFDFELDLSPEEKICAYLKSL